MLNCVKKNHKGDLIVKLATIEFEITEHERVCDMTVCSECMGYKNKTVLKNCGTKEILTDVVTSIVMSDTDSVQLKLLIEDCATGKCMG